MDEVEQKTSLNKFREMEVIPISFLIRKLWNWKSTIGGQWENSKYVEIKQHISKKKQKNKNPMDKEEINREIKKKKTKTLETNENGDTIGQNLWNCAL